LLAFLVERALEQSGDSLDESVVGREVFDRAEDFDPRLDPIVRVEVRRLRDRLDAYSKDEGAADPVVVSLPRRSYRPVFSARPPAAVERPARRGRSPRRVAVALGLAGLATLVAFTFGWPWWPTPPPGPPVSVAVLPFTASSTEAELPALAGRLTDGVTTELAAFRALSVVSRASASRFTDRTSIPLVARELGADLVMQGSVAVEAGRLHVTARLVDGQRDREVWVGQYDVEPDGLAALERRIAMEAAPACLASAGDRRR
jgi:serine/threonine-protein kinase